MRRYAKTLIEAAAYINRFNSRDKFLEDLLKHYENKNYITLIAYFRKQITTGFSVALTCNFLKEFDRNFCDIAKPDIHIKDTLCALYGRKTNYYQTEKKELECIGEMQELTAEINKCLEKDRQITVYQLDRMIWLICSRNFYLDNNKIDKDKYLKTIREN